MTEFAIIAAHGFTHAFELVLEDGNRVCGGANSLEDARLARIAATREEMKHGRRPIGAQEFKISRKEVVLMGAKLYIRRNGSFGASCDGTLDTGHHITEDSGRFTVYHLDGDSVLCRDAPRSEAEASIEMDWRKT